MFIDTSRNRELRSDEASHSSYSGTPGKADSLYELVCQRGKHEFVHANAASKEHIRSRSNHGMSNYHIKKHSNLSFDSLCNFTTSRDIPGSPVHVPGQKKREEKVSNL